MSAPALYVRDGSRFVLHSRERQHTPPIPVPVSLLDPEEEPAGREDPAQPGRTLLDVAWCPHGHAPRWAAGVDPRTGRPNDPACYRGV